MVKVLGAMLGFAVLMLAWSGTESQAQLSVCNGSSDENIDVAIAYEANGEWLSAGWYVVQRGRCETLLSEPLDNRYYYVFAKSDENTWASDDDEGREFCVMEDRAFSLHRQQYIDADGALQCEAHGYGQHAFHQIDVGDDTSFTQTFED